MGRSRRAGAALRELALAQARMLLRDPRAFVALLLGFAVLLAMFIGVDMLLAVSFGASPGLVRGNLGLIALMGFLAVGLGATAVPLVTQREDGLLRQIGTTPVGRGVFLLTHAPARAVILVAECGVLLMLATPPGAVDAVSVTAAPLGLTLLLGAAMLLALGYLLGARLARSDAVRHLAYLIPMLALVSSGALLPLELFPGPVRILLLALPTTWFVATFDAQLAEADPPLPLGAAWALMAAATVLMWAAAAKLFRWHR